ncbi:hypothetical protein NDU88_007425 [Pleurodeles waltl]|uniref:Uncharacterized protein n=1 Tax=Pleurodeles waltl TaxID=8319 RepID=A0AAV7VSU9_PLEWA|nr:hypothetical protein NDU88_007425 [Pleurodeles waltl]
MGKWQRHLRSTTALSSHTIQSLADMRGFLEEITVQELTAEARQDMKVDISSEEMGLAIRDIQTVKVQGLNSLQPELYRKLASELALHLRNML